MRQLFPEDHHLPVGAVHEDFEPTIRLDRPSVTLGMVSSLDGSSAVDGRTAGLGGEADRASFRNLRDRFDAVLVGGATARLEAYGPGVASHDRQRRRLQRGLTPSPLMVVLTASGQLDPSDRLFSDRGAPPMIIASAVADGRALERLRQVSDVVQIDAPRVAPARVLDVLRARSIRHVLLEGGPLLNGQFFEDDLVDEMFLTLTPSVTGGQSSRIVNSPAELTPRQFELTALYTHQSELLLHYRRSMAADPTDDNLPENREAM